MQKIVLLFFVLFSYLGIAQNKKDIDSLLSNISRLENPKNLSNSHISKVDQALKISTEAYYQSKEIGYEEGQVKALIFIIRNYIHIGNIKIALEKTNEGIKITQKKELQKYQVTLLVIKASLLDQLGYFDEAKINYNKAAEVIEEVPEFSADVEHYKNIFKYASFLLAFEQDNAQQLINGEKKEYYLQEAYKEVKQIKNNKVLKTYFYTHCLSSLATYYTELNQLDKAQQYIAEGDSLYSDHPGWVIKRNSLLGDIEKKKQNYPKAIEAYNLALKTARQYQYRYNEKQIYDWIAECYHKLNDYKNESLYLGKSKQINDSLDLAEKMTNGEVLDQATKNKNEESSFFDSTKFYYIIAIPLLIVLLVIILKRKTTKSNTIDVITEKSVEDETEKPDHETLNQLINLAEEDDPSFYFKFNDIFSDFSENLLKISPKLTQSDLEYCAMMKLNFDTKKIATIKRLSIGAVESKKYRIRKKLDISTEENIYIWLMDK